MRDVEVPIEPVSFIDDTTGTFQHLLWIGKRGERNGTTLSLPPQSELRRSHRSPRRLLLGNEI
eukprot:12598273-Prorocentrum_lima.AAC.1